MSGLVDTYIVYRIVTTLVKKWEDQDAYEYGIIDKNGKVLRKAKTLKTSKEKESYTVLIRFIFNMKRLMEKIPGGKSKISSYAVAALVFLREEAEDEVELKKLLGEDYDAKKL
jgi:ADP-glucose pyrophosphorylase